MCGNASTGACFDFVCNVTSIFGLSPYRFHATIALSGCGKRDTFGTQAKLVREHCAIFMEVHSLDYIVPKNNQTSFAIASKFCLHVAKQNSRFRNRTVCVIHNDNTPSVKPFIFLRRSRRQVHFSHQFLLIARHFVQEFKKTKAHARTQNKDKIAVVPERH
jgi:hypothetical protein